MNVEGIRGSRIALDNGVDKEVAKQLLASSFAGTKLEAVFDDGY